MNIIKKTFTERNLVIILFVMVLVTFSLAQQDSKKLDKLFIVFKAKEVSPVTSVKLNDKPAPNSSQTLQVQLQEDKN